MQATSTTLQGRILIFRHLLAVSGTWCAGHERDAFGRWQGRSLIFRDFWEVFGHGVQAIYRTRPDRSRIVARFLGICMQFVSMVCRPYPGRILVMVGSSPIFKHFLAFSGTRCPGHVRDASWPHVQAMFRVRLGHGRDAVWFPGVSRQFSGTLCVGHVQDTAGTHLDFHVFLDNFLDTMSRQFLGRVGAAAGMQSSFQAFLRIFWARCVGHVRGAY
ncbi:Hypothetical predicted protein [Olea europaea subsp. europaea]|uniref:Secreted protein n=1 Tax=Olea europaea subsp. europaea TaxID=158383 RepID=A0A8S0TQP1_OLEEU|nr:Hypothetical predicted protein [Olea europaea subsp. europaea]